MRVDGKFMIGLEVPEGQSSVATLLAECFDLAYELRTEAEERQEAGNAKLGDATDDGGAQAVGVGVQ